MEIKTKFNVGDKVWFVGFRIDKPIFDIAEVIIEDIFISNNKLFVILNFGKDKGTMTQLEKDCFATKEEAMLERQRRENELEEAKRRFRAELVRNKGE